MILNDYQLKEAREFLIECFPGQECEIESASEVVIRNNVTRHWDGGLADFIQCLEPVTLNN